MDEEEGEEMTEDISQVVQWLRGRAKDLEESRLRIEGMKMNHQHEDRTQDDVLLDLLLTLIKEFRNLDKVLATGILALNSNTATAEMHSTIANDRLNKLLGLMPNATDEEIRDAIDDVGPIIAGYRKKKRGT